MLKSEYDLLLQIKRGTLVDVRTLPADQRALVDSMCRKKWIFLYKGYDPDIDPAGRAAMSEHEELLDDLRQQHAREEEKQRADDVKAVKNKKQDRRHDFKVAAFSSAVTLALEHHADILRSAKVLFDYVWSLFH